MSSDCGNRKEHSDLRAGMMSWALLVLCMAPLTASLACDDTRSADLIIKGARMHGSGGAEATISVVGDRICSVVNAPSSTDSGLTIDAQGLLALPGLIDSHVHLFPMGSSTGIDNDSAIEKFIRDELPARMRDYLERGVTALISVGDAWPAVRDLRRKLAAGEIEGPRLFMTGPILTAPGGYPATTICADSPWCRSRLTVELRDEDHARQTVRELTADGVDAIKVVYDDARRTAKLTANLLRVVIDEAHANGLPVIGHATNVDDALESAELGIDVLAHLPAGGVIDTATASEFRQRGIIVVSTAGVYAPIDGHDGEQLTVFGLHYGSPFDRFHAQGAANARVLMEHGVPLAFGSGTAMFTPSESLDGEIKALSQIPLEPAQLVDALTINAARTIGKENELGSINVGKRADIILVKANTNNNSLAFANVVVVIKNGRIVIDRR